jgi:DNA-directed RNA polymerase beta subunit
MGDTERMILGTTGEMIKTPIAVGIVYYMALKHQAADKIYVRSKNVSSISTRKSIMSRQPISGRSKGGGLRLGEMEYDCLIAHGASKLVTEVSENSDMVDVPYCNTCKIVTDIFQIPARTSGLCRLCKTTNTVIKRVPFSYVILKDMLLAANINVQTEL